MAAPGSIGFIGMYTQVVTCPSTLPLQAQVVTTSERQAIITIPLKEEQNIRESK